MKKKWISIVSVILVLGLVSSASAFAAEKAVITSNIASFGADYLTKTDGSFWVWGGLQSVPTQMVELSNVETSFGSGLIQKGDHSVWLWRRNFPSLTISIQPVNGLSNIVEVYTHGKTLALDADGKVYISSVTTDGSWDLSKFELVAGMDNVVDIDSYYESNDRTGDQTFLFLKKDGTVWKSNYALDKFESFQNLKDIVQLAENTALGKDGTVWTWPKHFGGTQLLTAPLTATPIQSLKNIKTIKHDIYSNLAIDNQDRLWFWGATITGYSDGTIYTDHPDPVLLTGIKNVKNAYVVEHSLVVLTSDNKLYVTSIARDHMPANASFNLLASEVSSIKDSYRHIIIQKQDGTLWGWGVNKNAELGNGDYEFMHDTPVPVQKPIVISINNENVTLTNGVITRNGQNFVPLRSVFEKLGSEIGYNPSTKLAAVTRSVAGKPALAISVNATTGQTKLNNELVTFENSPFTVNGTVYLPLRFISEKLGATVEWLPQEERIAITMQ